MEKKRLQEARENKLQWKKWGHLKSDEKWEIRAYKYPYQKAA